MNSPLTIETDIDEIVENFSMLDDWEDRYGYLIELGKALKPFPEDAMNDANKVQGCVSQVWVTGELVPGQTPPRLAFEGTSDAHIVRGLVAIALTLFSGKTAGEIVDLDATAVFKQIGLEEHLTPQRANGLRAMVQRLKDLAGATLSQA